MRTVTLTAQAVDDQLRNIDFIKAYLKGEDVLFRGNNLHPLHFDGETENYTIKPKKKVYYMNVYKNGEAFAHADKTIADAFLSREAGGKQVTVEIDV